MDIQELIDSYASWLKSEISFDKIGEYYEITTPFLDHSNDYLQIYIKQDGDEIYFTDDGATINGLKSNGLQFTSSRKVHLQTILAQYGVELKNNELIAKAPAHHFAQKKHLFIQAMLRIDDMFSISKSKVSSFFIDDIQEFFQENDIYYADNVQFTGISGYTHTYDFLMQRTKTKPERLCHALNTPNRSNMGNILFAWNDTKPSRKKDSQLIILANDQNGMPKIIEDAFLNYGAKVIKWSERTLENNIQMLSA